MRALPVYCYLFVNTQARLYMPHPEATLSGEFRLHSASGAYSRACLVGGIRMYFVYRIGGIRQWPVPVGAALIAGLLASAGSAHAEEANHLAPVASLIDEVESGFGGRILMIELAQTPVAAGPARYDVKLLTDDGNVLRLHYDARTLKLEAVEGRDDRRAQAEVEDEFEDEDEVEREDADDIDRDRGDAYDDNSGSGSHDRGGDDDSSGSGSGGSGSSGSGSSGSGSGGSGGGSDDGAGHS